MANFFDGLLNIAKHPLDEAKWMAKETKGVVKPLLKGDVSESFDSFKGSFGRHNRMMSDNIAKPLGGHNKLTENPDAVAGAIVGGILAAPAIAGAAGGSSGAGAGGAAGSGGTGASAGGGGFSFGNIGSYFQPSTSFGEGAMSGSFNTGAPLTQSGMGSVGWNSGTATSGMNLGSSAYAPTTEFGGAVAGSQGTGASSAVDLQKWGKLLQSIKPQQEDQSYKSVHSRPSGFNYDSRVFENPILARTQSELYSEPLYRPLV